MKIENRDRDSPPGWYIGKAVNLWRACEGIDRRDGFLCLPPTLQAVATAPLNAIASFLKNQLLNFEGFGVCFVSINPMLVMFMTAFSYTWQCGLHSKNTCLFGLQLSTPYVRKVKPKALFFFLIKFFRYMIKF